MGKKAPLKHKDAETALKNLGFIKQDTKSTSHTQWKKYFPGRKPSMRKVTLDQHNSPYHRSLLKNIANQAGVSVAELYAAAGLK